MRIVTAHVRQHLVAYVALFLALSGSAYALSRGEVKTRHIAKGAVKTAKLADGSVKTAKLANGAVTREKLAAGALASEWINVGDEGAPPFYPTQANCRWVNVGSGHTPAGFTRDAAGMVHIRGLVKAEEFSPSSCNDPNHFGDTQRRIFTLPPGYRPAEATVFATIAGQNLGRITVAPDSGIVVADLPTAVADAKEYVSLEGITFRCAPSGVDGCP